MNDQQETTGRSFTLFTTLGSHPPLIHFTFPGPTSPLPWRINLLTGAAGTGKTSILRDLTAAAKSLASPDQPPTPHDQPPMTDPRNPFPRTRPFWAYRPGRTDPVQDILDALERIDTDASDLVLDTALQHLYQSHSFRKIHGNNPPYPGPEFRHWPLAHRLIYRTIARLAADLTPNNLAILDDPEAGLHPSLLPALWAGIHSVLELTDSVAIIGTNSPFIIQETPSSQVHLLDRNGQLTTAGHPPFETFGASIFDITTNLLSVDPTRSHFNAVLAHLAHRHTQDEIDDMFPNGMSPQARALTMTHIRNLNTLKE